MLISNFRKFKLCKYSNFFLSANFKFKFITKLKNVFNIKFSLTNKSYSFEWGIQSVWYTYNL